jgi:hypothetical protein
VYILGLDISTAITGYCVLHISDALEVSLADAGAIVTSKEKNIYNKAVVARTRLVELAKVYDLNGIFVEENLQAFRRGFSSAKTISTLARFNGIVSFLAEDIFSIPATMLNVNTARSKVGLKIDRKSTDTVKEQALDWVVKNDVFVNFEWPKKTLKSGPRKGTTISAPQCFDIADAAIIALAGTHILNNH